MAPDRPTPTPHKIEHLDTYDKLSVGGTSWLDAHHLLFLSACYTFFLSALICQVSHAALLEHGEFLRRNYTPQQYGGHAQVWVIRQDLRGVLYFRDGNGILEFDGRTWRQLFTPNGSTVRSLAVDRHGTVFAGGEGEIGFLAVEMVN